MKLRTLLLSTARTLTLAFDNRSGWKKTEDGALETDADGNPIYVDADGKESALAPGYVNRINSENVKYRTEARDKQAKLDAFGDLDPAAAKEAIEKMKDVNLDELVNKGEIEKVRTAVLDEANKNIADRDAKLTEAQQRIERLALDNAFNSSEFLKSKVAFPDDVVRATFRDRFEYDATENRVVPKTADGEPLRNSRGDIATVDEAFETFINARADKEAWLKAPGVGGSGSQGAGGGRGGGNTMLKAEYDKLDQIEKAKVGEKLSKGEMRLVD